MGLRIKFVFWFCALFGYCNAFTEDCSFEECPKSEVVALIPARAGSKGIPRKNLAKIGNVTLVGRAVNVAKEARVFDSIWVSTDGADIGEEVRRHDGRVHWRDPATATDNATTLSVVLDFLVSNPDVDIIAVVQCTSPFVKPDFLSKALGKMVDRNYDCIFSVTRNYHLRWTESEDGLAVPVNLDPRHRPRRQDWRGELHENGMFYIVKRHVVEQEGRLQNDRCGMYEIPKIYSLDIDTIDDLMIARATANYIDQLQ